MFLLANAQLTSKNIVKEEKEQTVNISKGALSENSLVPLYSHINTTDYKSVQEVENNEPLIILFIQK